MMTVSSKVTGRLTMTTLSRKRPSMYPAELIVLTVLNIWSMGCMPT